MECQRLLADENETSSDQAEVGATSQVVPSDCNIEPITDVDNDCDDDAINTSSDDGFEFTDPISTESNIDVSSDEEDNSSKDVPKIQKDLAEWVAVNHITQNATDKLLQILIANKVKDIPKCAKTLMLTPRKKIKTRIVAPGEYFHFGIQNHFLKAVIPEILEMKEIILDIGIDGLPVFQKSGQ